MGNDEKEYGHIMTEAILTGKEVEKFPNQQKFIFLALSYTKFSRLAEYLFMSNSPCNTGNRDGQYKKINNLVSQRHKR